MSIPLVFVCQILLIAATLWLSLYIVATTYTN
jgi:hypothetical protein